MIFVQSSGSLSQPMKEAVEQFCQFAFANTYPTVIINFQEFDPSHVCKGTTDPQPMGLVVTYNDNAGDSLDQILEVLAHESIHAHQLAQGRLKYAILKFSGGLEWGFMWDGTPYRYPKTAAEVVNLPWESDAYVQGRLLLKKWKEQAA